MNIQRMHKLAGDQRGLSTVEYTVLLVLIVACSVGAWTTFGGNLTTKLQESNAEFDRVEVTSSN